MTTPIHDLLEAAFQRAETTARNAEHALTSLTRHHGYHDTSNHNQERAVSLVDDIRTDLTDGVAQLEGFITRMKGNAPAILEGVAKLDAAPVVHDVVAALEAAGEAIGGPEAAAVIGIINALAAAKTAAPAPAA